MYAIISQDPLSILITYDIEDIPDYIIWPDGEISHPPQIGDEVSNNIFVNQVLVYEPPTSLHINNGSNVSYDSNTFTVTEVINFVEPEIDAMRDIANDRLVAWRNIQQDNGFTFANVVFESDPLSRSSIEGAVSMALIATMANTDYSVSWTSLDSSQHVMDANTVIQFGVTAATSFQTWHATCLGYKAQIDAANTAADIQAVLDIVGA